MADATSGANNGVNVAALIAAREALTKAPAAAQFKWRAACEWKNGTHSHSTVEGFYGLGQEQHHKKTFTFDADHPEVFASEDKGATPVTATFNCARSRRPWKGTWTSKAFSA